MEITCRDWTWNLQYEVSSIWNKGTLPANNTCRSYSCGLVIQANECNIDIQRKSKIMDLSGSLVFNYFGHQSVSTDWLTEYYSCRHAKGDWFDWSQVFNSCWCPVVDPVTDLQTEKSEKFYISWGWFLFMSCIGCRCPHVGSRGLQGPLWAGSSWFQPAPMDPQQGTAEPCSQGAGASGKTYLRKGKLLHSRGGYEEKSL